MDDWRGVRQDTHQVNAVPYAALPKQARRRRQLRLITSMVHVFARAAFALVTTLFRYQH